MSATVKTKKLFVLCLDGLSKAQFHRLAWDFPGLAHLLEAGCLKTVDARPLCCPQPFWAEFLFGKEWFDLDCPGYAKPASNLNHLEIVSEDSLASDSALLNGDDHFADVLVNLPLVKPKPGRFWLSDGSMPLQTTCYPRELSQFELFRAYKPRPFVSATAALADRSASVLACLYAERQRLDCAIQLLKGKGWRTAFLRLSVFDLLAHLIGHDFLLGENLNFRRSINEFLSFFGSALEVIFKEIDLASAIVLSSFSHVPCHSRLNLNLLLERGGFCRLEDRSADARLVTSGRRAHAVKLLNWTEKAPPNTRPMVSKTNSFDLTLTLAGSPVQGAVYLNRKNRFESGTVDDTEVLELSNKVSAYLKAELQKELAEEIFLWLPERGEHLSTGPDLMVYAQGVEIHNTVGPPIFDHVNRPRTTHAGEGFALLPPRLAGLPEKVRGYNLHRAIRECML